MGRSDSERNMLREINNMGKIVRMAQYGTKHGHAGGVLEVMLGHPEICVAGVYEPDSKRRKILQSLGKPPWSLVNWYDNKQEMLSDPSITAIASEGSNAESLEHTEEIIESGKHAFYDKPAGRNYAQFKRIMGRAGEKGLQVQMGYMFRFHEGFTVISDWARSGFLGDIFGIRAHMSTHLSEESQSLIAIHPGGIFYDLGGHMIDQIVWVLGRPIGVTPFFRKDASNIEGFSDNTLGVLEYERAMALVDIAAMEPRPMARRYEVYGTLGSAIMEPFEPAESIRLCLEQPQGNYPAGISIVTIKPQPRYVGGITSFLGDIRGEKSPDRSPDHELLVQETLLRATGDPVQ